MRLFYSILLVLLLVPGWSGEAPNDHFDPHVPFRLVPVERIHANSADRRVGDLVFLRGYRLISSDPAFGGFSALTVEGDRFTLLSDGGDFIRFRLDSAGRDSDHGFGVLPGGPGSGWAKMERDSESMTRDPATGQIWAGFETYNQIWRYSPDFSRPEGRAKPPAMRGWPVNGGAESMVRLHDGRFLVLAERQFAPGNHGRVGLLFPGDPVADARPPIRFVYRTPPEEVPSDATELPDGRVMILNRGFAPERGFYVTVTTIDPAAIRPGAKVVGKPIASFTGEVLHDNYEGVAVALDRGQPVLWIISDDNQSWFQQSLLLEFKLEPAR